MNIKKLIWLAGIFEGEGTTGLFKRKRNRGEGGVWHIQTYFLICNNDPIIIDKVKEIAEELGVNMGIASRHEDDKKHNWGINYQIYVKNMKDTYTLLEAIYPYLIGSKKYIAKLAMEFVERRDFGRKRGSWGKYTPRDFWLTEECKKYNQTGKNKKRFESSETIRQALEKGDDIVRTSTRVGEWIKPDKI